MILCATTFAMPFAKASPPFWGTIFLDPDIITESDPTTYQKLTDAGLGERTMYDRRSGWVYLNAFLFNASFSDGADIEIQVNPEFGDGDAARAEALKYAPAIGWNGYGQLGEGTTKERHSHVQVLSSGAADVSAERFHTLNRMAEGSLRTMCLNNEGQLGNGRSFFRTTAVQVATGLALP